MTTNQTIGGVPRELLERALAHILPISSSGSIRSELRALLDAHPCPVQLDGCDGSCATSAQPQGDTVPVSARWEDWSMVTLEIDGQHRTYVECGNKAEQPAPVAVVLPERKRADHCDESQDVKSYFEELGYNSCLDDVTRLNTKE